MPSTVVALGILFLDGLGEDRVGGLQDHARAIDDERTVHRVDDHQLEVEALARCRGDEEVRHVGRAGDLACLGQTCGVVGTRGGLELALEVERRDLGGRHHLVPLGLEVGLDRLGELLDRRLLHALGQRRVDQRDAPGGLGPDDDVLDLLHLRRLGLGALGDGLARLGRRSLRGRALGGLGRRRPARGGRGQQAASHQDQQRRSHGSSDLVSSG
ncbi:MAG: hypothetical protein QM765_15125 [Myxococcales bacterium]